MAARRRARDIQLLQDQIGPIGPRAQLPPRIRPSNSDAQPVLILDVRRLQLLGVFKPNSVGQLVWAPGDGARASALYSHRGHTLTIHEVTRGGTLEPLDTEIKVVQLAAFSGAGSRPWLTCPTPGCGKRALKLYLAPEGTAFRCRSCLGREKPGRSLARLEQATAHDLGDITVAC